LPQALSAAGNAPVYFHPAVTRSRFSIRDGKAKPIGMPVASRLALASVPGSRLFRVEEPLAPWNGVGLSGPIPRCTDFEDVGGPFFLDAGGSEPDPVSDDLAAWIRTAEGLVVILGCCHAGLVNTVTHCREQSGENRIAAIIGGMHLGEAGPERLARTVAALAALRPALLVPCHCTGENAVAALQDAFPGRTTPGLVGESFRFSVAAG
jgi:7,8-dihydropterin-6-yl-methyl-4-(beta-D-ribofuranosyl)aminobenzene 5'-phosphate synthase